MHSTDQTDVIVIGAGSIGIAVAYYLQIHQNIARVILVDPLDPMSLTSAASGENYRNWWPHPVMTTFTNYGIDLLEEVDRCSSGRINMTRSGYALVTRRTSPSDLIDDLYRGYGGTTGEIRLHDTSSSAYLVPKRSPWTEAPAGVDVLTNRNLIRRTFPSYAEDVETVIHVRRAGSFSAQQMGQFMLEQIRAIGGHVVKGRVEGIEHGQDFKVVVSNAAGTRAIRAARVVNAAGPFFSDVGRMLGEELPVKCVYQQKIAFEDRAGALPRSLPFTIDLDPQTLIWSDEDRALLAEDETTRYLTETIQGGAHCRPDGAVEGKWVKLGWAFNHAATDPHQDAPTDSQFPDTLLRGVSRLNPRLASYIGRLPRGAHHYGGYYTTTEENWPLIGPMRTRDAFIAGALSGFGSMAACATGALCAAWVAGKPVPEFARSLSSARYGDAELMNELSRLGKGTL